ncbi:MAG TPA: bifunctional oligoribonuclease/PAP phosphatase NrnA [Syntrophales bacterium]|nr:bifunctional oligoribonuclease/PAP phosphatase NrnA [Syntrophales bacterium]
MIRQIAEIIQKGRTFLVTSHVRLDGDAVGSELALYEALKSLGKEAVVYNQDRTPQMYAFLPDAGVIVNRLGPLDGFDAVFVLDCSEIERMGEEAPRIAGIERIVNIDHHISNDRYGHLTLTDPEASSTGEMIFRLIDGMGIELTRDMAVNLYTAILTDTGAFRYSNTGPKTFAVAGRLLEKGADPAWIAQMVYETFPAVKIRLLSRALSTLEFDWQGRIAAVTVSKKMLEDAGAQWEHTEGFVEYPRSIEGVQVAAFFSEISEGLYKVSLRSKGRFSVEEVARKFGGGGHINAAACRMQGDYDAVKRRLFDAIKNGGR